jgi:acetate kinase
MANALPIHMTTLTINAGSSTVKCALFTFAADPSLLTRTVIDEEGGSRVPRMLEWIRTQTARRPIGAIAYRIVHGGTAYSVPVRITSEVLDDLRNLIPFAPNHLPDEIAIVEAMRRQHPTVAHVACFDTAFHRTLPEVARRLPLPAEYDAQGVQRYGFHGLSYSYLAEQLRRLAGSQLADARVILAHLGNGSSLAALHKGRSVDTTMAFTPIGGVVMSTRSGDLDPGVVTYLGRTQGLSHDALEELLSRRAGLWGLSGGTSDMRALMEGEASDPAAALAVAAYIYSVKKAVGALAAALGGLDAFVFAGGIGEHAPSIRARIVEGLEFLGLNMDVDRNRENGPLISSDASRVSVWVIPTDEELTMARAVYHLLAAE